jgi:hypothetical protein
MDELVRVRQRHLWKVIGNGFARPFLDRCGPLREDRTGGINYLRSLAGLAPLLKYRPDPVPAHLWSPRRVNVLVRELRLRSYLEVGVFEGETFANVCGRRRYGVDPQPLFDVALLPRRSSFAVTTSDDFFTALRPSKRFDVAFLAGLHTFEQTYRDLVHTFANMRNGVILVDDTVPVDEYSAIPDQAASYRPREAAGLKGRPWHGDVWRVVWLLERHHHDLEWRTIIDEGNPQTLVWRRTPASVVSAASDDEIELASSPTYARVRGRCPGVLPSEVGSRRARRVHNFATTVGLSSLSVEGVCDFRPRNSREFQRSSLIS